MDVWVTKELAVELIEFNSFGAGFAAGSSCFSWITDRSQLYGENNVIEIRVVIDDQ